MLLLPGKDADTSSGTPVSPDNTAETAMPDNVADLRRSSQFSAAEDASTGAVAGNEPILDSTSGAVDNAGAVLDSVSGSAGTDNTYIPGIYTTELILGSETANVEVIVNDHAITSVSLTDPSETLTTMYPLLEPTMESLNDQLCEMQDPSQVTIPPRPDILLLVLLEAVKASLEKAKPKATPEATGTPENDRYVGSFHCSDGNYCTGGFPRECNGHFVGNGWENRGTYEDADSGYQSGSINT